jgi:hypothetical protein
MFLNDQDTATDLLYYEAIAKTIVTLIRKTPDAPVSRVLCLWFNGWTFEGFEDAKTVVIETFVDEPRRARPMSQKVAAATKKVAEAGGLAEACPQARQLRVCSNDQHTNLRSGQGPL